MMHSRPVYTMMHSRPVYTAQTNTNKHQQPTAQCLMFIGLCWGHVSWPSVGDQSLVSPIRPSRSGTIQTFCMKPCRRRTWLMSRTWTWMTSAPPQPAVPPGPRLAMPPPVSTPPPCHHSTPSRRGPTRPSPTNGYALLCTPNTSNQNI